MARIKGIILIGCSLGVILLSLLFNWIKKTSRFNLFIIISIVILLWGILNLVLEKLDKKAEPPKQEEVKTENIINYENAKIKKESAPKHPHHMSIVACHNCGLKHYNHANFCQQCGINLRK